jgi:hypothetical protein
VLQVLSLLFLSAFISWSCDLKSTFSKAVPSLFVIPVVARHVVRTHDGVGLAHAAALACVAVAVTLYALLLAWKTFRFFQGWPAHI